MNESELLFFSETHHTSALSAVLADDGNTGWLFLSGPDSTGIISDVWVFNSTVAESPATPESPPSAPGHAVRGVRFCPSPHDHDWAFVWNESGDEVILFKDGEPVACVMAGEKYGMNRHLVGDGPWGRRWSNPTASGN